MHTRSMPDEIFVAEKRVKPYITKKLRWNRDLVSEYGRVPVQVGRRIVWADFALYFTRDGKRHPYLLIEVKKPNESMEDAVLQAESYSLMLNAPFFCATDGAKYEYYFTGGSQGNSIKLSDAPPTPEKDFLRTQVMFPPRVDDLVELFIVGLKTDSRFRDDMLRHVKAASELREQIFAKRIESLSLPYLRSVLGNRENIMDKKPNINRIFSHGADGIIKMLKYIRDSKDNSMITIQRLIEPSNDPRSNLAIKGAKLFFVTQLLSAVHPDRYVALHENISRALKDLDVTDITIRPDNAKSYVYVNEICRRLFSEKMETRLKEEGLDFKLWAVHQFLWHYYAYYRKSKKWTDA